MMKNTILTIAMLFIFSFSFSQAEKIVNVDALPLYQIEKCDDDNDLSSCSEANLLAYNAKLNYPSAAVEKKQEGSVYVKFIVTSTGEVENVELAKSSGYTYLDRAGIQHVINTSGMWKPAMLNNENVNYELVLPIHFKL